MSDELEKPLLSLPRSFIEVRNGELIRSSNSGNVIARHTLSEINSVEWKKVFDPYSIVFFFVGIALSFFPYHQMEDGVFRWILMVAGVGALALSILGCLQYRLVLKLEGGEEMIYTINDLPEELKGFTLSLSKHLNELGNEVALTEVADSAEPQVGGIETGVGLS